MKMNTRFFAESLVVKLGIALGAIVLLALTAALSATVFTESSTGKAAAINLARATFHLLDIVPPPITPQRRPNLPTSIPKPHTQPARRRVICSTRRE